MTEASLSHVQLNHSLWRYVWKLLRLRGVILISEFRRARLRRKIGMIVLALLATAGLVFAFVLSWLLLRFMRSPELAQFVGDTRPLLASMPTLVISGAFAAILITSFAVLLQALYLAGDMDFLLSAPVPIRAIFITKLLQATLPNFSLILLFGLPVLYGLGASGGYNILYYPLVLIVLALVALATAGLSSLLVMGVVRIFPARRVAEILGFVVAIVSFTCSQSGQFARYASVSQDQAAQMLNLATRFNTPWSPLTWAGRGLVDIGEGNWLSGAGLVLLTIAISCGVFALSLATAERLYYSGWASVQVSTGKKAMLRTIRPVGKTRLALAAPMRRLLPADVRGIIAKDWMVLRRDLRNMSQLVTPLILGIVYALMLVRSGGQPPPGRGEAPAVFTEITQNMLVYGNVGISLFVSWSLLSRLAALGFSLEGKNYWMIKIAPISTARLLAGKYLVAFLPTLALGWVFLLIISLVQRVSTGTLIFGLLVVAMTIAATAGLNLAFGVIGANFNWEDPRRVTQGGVGCLGALASMLFLGASMLFFFGPAVLLRVFGGPAAAGELAGLALGGILCLVCGFLPLWLVRKKVPRLAED
jgi:ABC-2 type transport system permease protein